MKILKKNEHSLLPRPIFIQGRPHLALAVVLFFDLTAPETLLQEQELWKAVPKELGDPPVLDQGMPKLTGEFLATGACYPPRGEEWQSGDVRVRVGEMRKKLFVYGNRHWNAGGRISAPEPFRRMDLSWENAFGGKDFPQNPLGKGRAPAIVDGEERKPLPNVEDPAQLIGSPEDTPPPACFGPLGLDWPQRNKDTGTFDKRWKTERWPGLPDDFDYSYFNMAPHDQRLEGFFRGDEPLEILNMHPDMPYIKSSLPGVRIRAFATLRQGYTRFAETREFPEVFQEIALHPETLWLLPGILRGVLIFRGATPVADEDLGDVARLFVATETMDTTPLSIEHYQEEQKRLLDRSVPVDLAPLEAAKGRISQAMLSMKNAPKEAEAIRKKALGQAPVMPRSAEELAQGGKDVLAGRMQTLDRLEALAGRMNQRWGHLARVDTSSFGALRQRMSAIGAGLDKSVGKLNAAKAKAEAKKAAIVQKNSDYLKENLTPEQLQQAGMDPDNLFPDRSVNPWHDTGFPFVVQCRRNLEQHRDLQQRLMAMGLTRKTMRRSWLGLNPRPLTQAPAQWGLEGTNDFTLPSGLVLPRFKGRVLERILLRHPDPDTVEEGRDAGDGAYVTGGREDLVPGSDQTPLFLPAAAPYGLVGARVTGDDERTWAPLVVVADELQALLMEQEAGDACGILAMKTPKQKPGDDAAQAVKKARAVLVITPEHAAPVSWAALDKEAKLLPLPRGQSVFAAKAAGVDLRRLVMDALPPEVAKEHELFPDLPEGAPPKAAPELRVPALPLDIGGLVAGLMQEVTAAKQPKLDQVKGNRGRMIAALREKFEPQGLDPEKSLADAARQPAKSFAQSGDEMAEQMLAKGREYKAAGRIDDQQEALIREKAQKIKEISQKSQARFDSHTARLAQKKQQAEALKAQAQAKKLPGGGLERMGAAGLSPENLKVMTREQVLERYAAGQDFARRNLSGLDLSGLDLHGIDLRKAILEKTILAEANLEDARLDGAMAMGADCSKARLARAVMTGAVLAKAKFVKADLNDTNLSRVTLKEADLSGADLSGAKMRLLHAEKAVLKDAVLSDADVSLSLMASCDLSGASFRNARLHKLVLRECSLDAADFRGATMKSTVLQGCHGQGVTFAGANMDNARITSNSSLPSADFQKVTLRHASFRESSLPDAAFPGASLDAACFEGCSLIRATLERVSAKRARITKCDLEAANLRAVNLAQGSLRMTRLVQADLSGANLFGVDFYKAIVGNTQFHLANLKRTLLHDTTDLLR